MRKETDIFVRLCIMTERFLSFPKPSIKSDFKIACFWRHFLQKWQQNWPFLPPLFIEEKSWRQNGLVLVAKFFKMTAQLTGFAVNYKIRKSSNLTKACACHRQNREIRPLQEISSAFSWYFGSLRILIRIFQFAHLELDSEKFTKPREIEIPLW